MLTYEKGQTSKQHL